MIIHEYSWIMRPQCCLGFVGLALGLIFQQLFPCIPLCVPSQSLIDAQTVPNSKTFQRCSRSNINCIHSFQKVKFIAGCSYILYNVHSYVLVLDSVGQYIQVIFLFHNITWFLVKYFAHRWRDLMWQWGLNVRVSSVIEHWQKLMLGRKGDGGEGGRWGGREVMWLYSERSHFCLTALSWSSSARSWSPQSMG